MMTQTMKSSRKAIIALAMLIGSTASLNAHSGATGVVKERMDMMKSIGEATKTIGEMVKGDRPYASGNAANAAYVIADHAVKIPQLFPEGSINGPSESLPLIWLEWDSFTAKARALEKRSADLASIAEASESVDEIRSAFAALAKNCRSCHEAFRLEK